ncbi:MAG: thioredoxin [Oxalobacter sp.]|nr:MAG: thioredoxin [Oxalobacter sp.]
MPCITLAPENYQSVLDSLTDDTWIVACLCAEWCGTCRGYRQGFDELADRHPDKHVIWIDVENCADVVGDLEQENFPTLLVQFKGIITYYAPVLPDHRQVDRLLASLTSESIDTLLKQANSSDERKSWQENCNMRILLQNAIDEAS